MSALGASLAAVASALCCAGSVLYVLLGAGGVVTLARIAPARPYLFIGSILLLGLAFWSTSRRRTRCSARAHRRSQVIVWVAAAATAASVVLPWLVS